MRPLSTVCAVLFATACCIPASCVAVAPGSPMEPTGAPERADGGASGISPISVRASIPTDQARLLVGFPRLPALSPDGRTLVFSSAGDLWTTRLPVKLPEAGPLALRATRLTSHPAEERLAAFSPDGTMLAFESDRDGARNLYVMPIRALPEAGGGTAEELLAGDARRVTFSDAAQSLGSFTADGSALLFSASQEPTLYRQSRMYTVSLADGQVKRLTDAHGFLPRAAADGDAVVFGRGYASLWDRPAYRGSGAMELHRFSPGTGEFTRLTTSDANDGDGFQLPDGSVVFVSSRDGQNNVWRLAPGATDQGGGLGRLTEFKVPAGEATIGHGVRDLTVARGGEVAALVVWDTMYVLDLTRAGAAPVALAISVSADTSEGNQLRLNLERQVSESVLSPDGKTLALIARGEVFVRHVEEGRPTRRVTRTHARERDLAWSPDGRALYFASDESGAYAIHQATVSLTRDELEPPAPPAAPAQAAAKPAPEAAAAGPGAGEAAAAAAAGTTTSEVGAGSPAAPTGAAATLSGRAATETGKEAKPEKVDHGKRWAESLLFEVVPLVSGAEDARHPTPSPDGLVLAYVRGRGDLVVRDLATNLDRVLLSSWDEPEMVWAGDSQHAVYAVQDLDYNSDLWLMDTHAAEPAAGAINLTRHPDSDGSPRLSVDGKVLTFLSERAGENGEFDVWQVYLDKKLEGLKAYELDEYYKKAAEAASKRKPLGATADSKSRGEGSEGKSDDAKGGAEAKGGGDAKSTPAKPAEPMKFDASDAYQRVRRVTSIAGSENELTITPAADRLMFVAAQESDRALVSIDRKGEDKKVLQAGPVSSVSTSLTGDKVVFVRTGVASTTSPKGGGKVEAVAIDAPVTIDLPAQQRQKFLEAARILGTQFYHNTMKDLDWEALTRAYLSLAMQTRSTSEFNEVVAMLFGELNGSHTGISGGATGQPPARPSIGFLGIESEAAANGHRVTRVVEGSPADQPTSRLEVGDVIIGVDGVKLIEWARVEPRGGVPDLSEALLGKAGKETLLEVERVKADQSRYVLIVPASAGAMTDIGYRAEIARRRDLVDRQSGGRLGYLHIRSMNDPSVRDFERDLYAAGHGKDGLIIDVRDNGGGYTTDILLASLTAPVHAKTAPRGVDHLTVPPDTYPRDRRLIYAYTRPICVVINENSFSNAEVFAHAIQTIKRGPLVGTTTFGAVISTGAASLIDGSTVRVPGRGWWLPDGRDMENNGAAPDVSAAQTPEDDAKGRDAQIEAAVRELLGRVGAR